MPVYKSTKRAAAWVLVFAFLSTSNYIPAARAGQLVMPLMPRPGAMVALSSAYTPSHVMGMTIHPENPFQFDFFIHKSDEALSAAQKTEEYGKLIKYFLASLTVPDQDQWVNLSPYEQGHIIEGNFGKTQMGRDLLEQDYLLKQITSSLMYPESGLGKKFWDRVYARAWNELHTTDIPVNTFNKVWIVPDKAVVYESGYNAYIIQSHLKVMLEEDYLSLYKHQSSANHTVASQVIRQIILPELESEVNQGRNFAPLRQIVGSMILAAWYKKALRESLLGKIYADKDKVNGLKDGIKVETIYGQYLAAFRKGVYNYIKDDTDKYTHEPIARKYFAGGFEHPDVRFVNQAMLTSDDELIKSAQSRWSDPSKIDRAMVDMTVDQKLFHAEAEQGHSLDPKMIDQFRERLQKAKSEMDFKFIVSDVEKYIKKTGRLEDFNAGKLDGMLFEFSQIMEKREYMVAKNPSPKGKRLLLLYRIIPGKLKIYQNPDGKIYFYYMMLKTPDDAAISYPRLIYTPPQGHVSVLFLENLNSQAKKYERVKKGAVLAIKADMGEHKEQVIRLLATASEIIQKSLLNKNLTKIAEDLESLAHSLAFQTHRLAQLQELPSIEDSRRMDDRRVAFVLFDGTNPLFDLGRVVEQTAVDLSENKPGAWDVLFGLSGTNSPEGVFKWLKNSTMSANGKPMSREDIDNEIRSRAAEYYKQLTHGQVPVKHQGFILYTSPVEDKSPGRVSSKVQGVSEPVTLFSPLPVVLDRLSTVHPIDRFKPVQERLKIIFENPEAEDPDGINKLIAKAKGRRGKDSYHDALQAIADEVAVNGVTAYTLLAMGETGVTRLEEQIAIVMRETNTVKVKFGNMPFKAYFNLIPAIAPVRAANVAISVTSRNIPIVNGSGFVTNDDKKIENPEIWMMNGSYLDDLTGMIYRNIMARTKSIMKRIAAKNAGGKIHIREFSGIYHRTLNGGKAFYFRYFPDENIVVFLAAGDLPDTHVMDVHNKNTAFGRFLASNGVGSTPDWEIFRRVHMDHLKDLGSLNQLDFAMGSQESMDRTIAKLSDEDIDEVLGAISSDDEGWPGLQKHLETVRALLAKDQITMDDKAKFARDLREAKAENLAIMAEEIIRTLKGLAKEALDIGFYDLTFIKPEDSKRQDELYTFIKREYLMKDGISLKDGISEDTAAKFETALKSFATAEKGSRIDASHRFYNYLKTSLNFSIQKDAQAIYASVLEQLRQLDSIQLTSGLRLKLDRKYAFTWIEDDPARKISHAESRIRDDALNINGKDDVLYLESDPYRRIYSSDIISIHLGGREIYHNPALLPEGSATVQEFELTPPSGPKFTVNTQDTYDVVVLGEILGQRATLKSVKVMDVHGRLRWNQASVDFKDNNGDWTSVFFKRVVSIKRGDETIYERPKTPLEVYLEFSKNSYTLRDDKIRGMIIDYWENELSYDDLKSFLIANTPWGSIYLSRAKELKEEHFPSKADQPQPTTTQQAPFNFRTFLTDRSNEYEITWWKGSRHFSLYTVGHLRDVQNYDPNDPQRDAMKALIDLAGGIYTIEVDKILEIRKDGKLQWKRGAVHVDRAMTTDEKYNELKEEFPALGISLHGDTLERRIKEYLNDATGSVILSDLGEYIRGSGLGVRLIADKLIEKLKELKGVFGNSHPARTSLKETDQTAIDEIYNEIVAQYPGAAAYKDSIKVFVAGKMSADDLVREFKGSLNFIVRSQSQEIVETIMALLSSPRSIVNKPITTVPTISKSPTPLPTAVPTIYKPSTTTSFSFKNFLTDRHTKYTVYFRAYGGRVVPITGIISRVDGYGPNNPQRNPMLATIHINVRPIPVNVITGIEENGRLKWQPGDMFDPAMNSTTDPGGIDLNAGHMDLEIKRDSHGMPLPLAQQDLAQLSQIQGIVPVIISIRPAGHLSILDEIISRRP